MRYVALLRGVNVGGAGKIDMKGLRAAFEDLGLGSVRTYINSGNVIFDSEAIDRESLAGLMEDTIEERFGFRTRVLIMDVDEIRSIVRALPEDWRDDAAAKCDVFFLWEEADRPSVIDELVWDPKVEDVRYTLGALIRRVDRKHAARSKITRIVGTPLYQQMTVRNCNTARALLRLMEE